MCPDSLEMERRKIILDSSLKKLLAFVAAAITSFFIQINLLQINYSGLIKEDIDFYAHVILNSLFTSTAFMPCLGCFIFMSGITSELLTIAWISQNPPLELDKITEKIKFSSFSRFYTHFTPKNNLTRFTKIGIVVITAVSVIIFILTIIRIWCPSICFL
jgi:hypothetical protein